ncbi:hypothetical protein [Halomonas alkalicola]|uniref:Uncharacterized protein n=1 Tax=Halomonas alkalicola TaxID=1930622 RepID=A0ABY9H5A6_9GAMM|nr:hypothetical protein [Halomonas alkalicola]WLI73624.1 hypothetical protein B6N23_01395 [Halomonas alkalicola]
MATFHFHDLLINYPFGEAISQVLNPQEIRQDIKDIANFSTSNLPTVLYTGRHPPEDSNIRANSTIVEERFASIAERLYRFAVLDYVALPENPELLDDDVLDFRAFVGFGAIAAELYAAASYKSLTHLLAVFLLRYKIEWILCGEKDGSHRGVFLGEYDLSSAHPEVEQYFFIEEIAIASGLKLETVKNALSRKEIPRDRLKRIPARSAITWISRKEQLPWGITCRFIDDRLPINGQTADAWLDVMTDWERTYVEPQGSVSTWRVPRSNRYLMINSGGRRKCILTLPFEPDEGLLSLGVLGDVDRSHESTSHFHDRGFPGGRPAKLWQVTVPSLRVLKAVVDHLAHLSLSIILPSSVEEA